MSCTHFGTMNIGHHAFFKVETFTGCSDSMWSLQVAHFSGEFCGMHIGHVNVVFSLLLNIYEDQIPKTVI